MRQRIFDGLVQGRDFRQSSVHSDHPGVQCLHDRLCFSLPNSAPVGSSGAPNLFFDRVDIRQALDDFPRER